MARPSTPEERAQMVRQLYEMQREEAEREHAGRNGANAEADDGEPVEPRTIADVADTFRRWLYFPHNDLGVLNVSLGTAAANHYDTTPIPAGC